MSRRRFSDYKKAISLLRTSTSGATPPTLPAGSPLAEYQDYISGNKNITYTRDPASLPGSIDRTGIKPFGYADDPNNIVPVSFSNRAKTFTGVSALIAKANHVTSGTYPLDLNNFSPAKAVVSIATSSGVTTATSQITGRAYRKKDTNSYTIPFGRKDATSVELTVRNEITAAIPTASAATTKVSFQSERV